MPVCADVLSDTDLFIVFLIAENVPLLQDARVFGQLHKVGRVVVHLDTAGSSGQDSLLHGGKVYPIWNRNRKVSGSGWIPDLFL